MRLKCRAVYLNSSPFGSRNIADPRLAQSRAIDIHSEEHLADLAPDEGGSGAGGHKGDPLACVAQ